MPTSIITFNNMINRAVYRIFMYQAIMIYMRFDIIWVYMMSSCCVMRDG